MPLTNRMILRPGRTERDAIELTEEEIALVADCNIAGPAVFVFVVTGDQIRGGNRVYETPANDEDIRTSANELIRSCPFPDGTVWAAECDEHQQLNRPAIFHSWRQVPFLPRRR